MKGREGKDQGDGEEGKVQQRGNGEGKGKVGGIAPWLLGGKRLCCTVRDRRTANTRNAAYRTAA